MWHYPSRISVRRKLCSAILAANAAMLLNHAEPALAQPRAALEEVIVTARKREESVQEVPIAVSAFSGDQLRDAGISSLNDIASQVPGVSIDSGSIAQIWIRGVGQRDFSTRIDGPTGIYLDGIYLARKEGQLLDMFDTESIQVLRGPQGTLFGKNTTAGAFVISTRKPANEFGGELSTRLGNYNRLDSRLMLNLPLIEDKLLSKVTLANVKRDGYQTNVVNDKKMGSEDRQAANVQLRWLASDSVTVDGFVYASKVREVASSLFGRRLLKSGYAGQDSIFANYMWPGDTRPVYAFEYTGANVNPAWDEVSRVYSRAFDQNLGLGDHDVVSNSANHYNIDNYIAGITAEWDISDDLTFKSITGYGYQRVGAMSTNADNDGTAMDFQYMGAYRASPRTQVSQELQLIGDAFDQRMNYTAGIFAMIEDIEDYNASHGLVSGLFIPSSNIITVNRPGAFRQEFKQKNTTLAAFFQTSYDITENLQGTVGVRWTSETRDVTTRRSEIDPNLFRSRIAAAGIPGVVVAGNNIIVSPAALAGDPLGAIQSLFGKDAAGFLSYPYGAGVKASDEKTWIELSPMASIKYTLPEQWLDGSPVNSAMTYFTYSEGFKSGAFEQVGSNLTQIDPETIKNFEVGVKIDALDRTLRLNLAAYHMKYDNMQLIQAVPDQQTGRSVVAYVNASKSEITGAELEFAWQPVPALLISAGASHNDYDFKGYEAQQLSMYHFLTQQPAPMVNRSSEPFPEVPSVTGMLAVQYTFDLQVGTLTPRLQYNYTGKRYMGLDPGAALVRDQSTLDSYERIDARLTYQGLDGRLLVALYCNNVTDELYYEGAAAVGDSVGAFPLVDALPRMYGLEASYKFGAM